MNEYLQPIPIGECLEHCNRILWLARDSQARGWRLCQGWKSDHSHCWLEHQGLVYDLTLIFAGCLGIPRDVYYTRFRISKVKRYTARQVAMNVSFDGGIRFWAKALQAGIDEDL